LSFGEEKRYLMSPPPHLEYFSFGYQASLSVGLWVRAIQDFDYCERKTAKTQCEGNSWLFHTLDTASRLSPDFKEIYTLGATALSILVSDVPGAAVIFERGVAIFPDHFNLVYRAGYHALLEEKDEAKAAKYFTQAAKIQGVEGGFLYSLATRLYTDSGKREVALRLYEDMKNSGLDPSYLKRMREKLGIEDTDEP